MPIDPTDIDNLAARILDFMNGREPMNSIAIAAGVLGYALYDVPYDDMMLVKAELEKLRERGEVRLEAGYCLAPASPAEGAEETP